MTILQHFDHSFAKNKPFVPHSLFVFTMAPRDPLKKNSLRLDALEPQTRRRPCSGELTIYGSFVDVYVNKYFKSFCAL